MDQTCFNICLWILSIIIAVSVCSILIKSKKFNKCSCDHHNIEGYEEAKEISVNSVNTDNITVKNDLGLKNKIMLYNGNDKSIELDNDTGDIRGTSLYGQVYGDVNGNVTGSTITGTKINGTHINSTNITNAGNITNSGTFTNKGTAKFNNNVSVDGRITGKELQLSGLAMTYNISNARDINNGGDIYTTGFIRPYKGVILSDIDDVKIGNMRLLDIIYPVGTVYQSTKPTSPATLFGGRWVQIRDRFLYAGNSANEIGGSSTVTLDIENIPSFRTNSIVENQIRQSKDLFITTIALITRAAISEGVNIEEALTLSDNFIQKIENSRTMKELNEIILSALTEFTTKVSYLKNVQTQTEFTLKLSNFIIHNISRKLTIDDLVNNFYISKTSLCEKVKNDSGLTVNEFINTTKIGVAKDLLSNTTNSILSISDYLGFSSQNHFVKVFKKYVGVTPSEYRKNQNLKNSWANHGFWEKSNLIN